MTTINNNIEKARQIIDRYDYYEVFANEDEVRAYIPSADELDDPMPEIWAKRIAACEEIIRDKAYPCIFNNTDCVVECLIDEDGFTFDGKHYQA